MKSSSATGGCLFYETPTIVIFLVTSLRKKTEAKYPEKPDPARGNHAKSATDLGVEVPMSGRPSPFSLGRSLFLLWVPVLGSWVFKILFFGLLVPF